MAGKRSSVDYYEVLGVGPEATEPEIRRAYRRLAFQRHPDRNPGDPAAAERFREISEAYAVLSHAARRAEYDRARRTGAAGTFRVDREDLFRDLFADARAGAVFEELARDFERMGMHVDRHYFRETLFGGRAVVTGGIFIISPLSPVLGLLKLARAALTGTRRESVTGAGRSALPAADKVLSGLKRFGLRLLGVPSLPSPADSPDKDIFLPLVLTEEEAARGGRRQVAVEREGRIENLMVTIPSGIRAGSRLRLRGKGTSGGDLYLTIRTTGSDIAMNDM